MFWPTAPSSRRIRLRRSAPVGIPVPWRPVPHASRRSAGRRRQRRHIPPVAVTVGPAADTTVPRSASRRRPVVLGRRTVTVTATASDAVGVTSVTFLADGARDRDGHLFALQRHWNTSAVAAGSHTLRAVSARCRSNVGLSATVTVTVTAANKPPVVTMTAHRQQLLAPPADARSERVGSGWNRGPRGFLRGSHQNAIGQAPARSHRLGRRARPARMCSAPSRWTIRAPRRRRLGQRGGDRAHPAVDGYLQPSADHSIVTKYVFDVFANGSNPATSTPVATQNLVSRRS